ncbi:MAG: universal stress protein [Dehalococcoidia bacterium]|nr:MAG: universal stress protein [Dehalococcoidia bacterium]
MYRKILVPLDGSEVAECALPHMQVVAAGCNVVEILLLRVIGPLPLPGDYIISEGDRKRLESQHRSEAQSYLGRITKQLGESGLDVHADIVEGEAAERIVEYADKQRIDLIVMATHGRSGIGRWALGSVADRVVHHSRVPVLLVRASKDACAA